ncbi:MAG: hypothetical protein K0R98_1180 [Rickettsiaceae bacterium]|nr:hypothetical protein [Rickettsiaceae bacterium]
MPEVVTVETLAQSILWRAQYSALESLRISLKNKDTLITAKKEITKLLTDNGLDDQKTQLLFEQGEGRKKLERLCDQCALHCVKNYESYKEKDPNSKLGRKITMYHYTPDSKSINRLEKCVQTFVTKHMPEEQSISFTSHEKSKSDSPTHSSKFQKETSRTFAERSQSSSDKEQHRNS